MGVNLCLVKQQQKNLCVALNPHVLERMKAASALFCFRRWLSSLTVLFLPFLYLSRFLSCFFSVKPTLFHSFFFFPTLPVSFAAFSFSLLCSSCLFLSCFVFLFCLYLTPPVFVSFSLSLLNLVSVRVSSWLPSLSLYSLFYFSLSVLRHPPPPPPPSILTLSANESFKRRVVGLNSLPLDNAKVWSTESK